MTVFSIILPVYNVEMYLEKCLKSILRQSFKDFELICINDASTDKSIDILETYAQKDNRIKIITQPQNRGLGAARNTGLEVATGKYLCCVDSDDWVADNWLRKIFLAFENNNVASVWYRIWNYFPEVDKSLEYIYINRDYDSYYNNKIQTITPDNIIKFPAYAWNKAYKLDCIKENNLYWMENVYFEDMFFYYTFYMLFPSAFLMEDRLYYYTQRQSSITGSQKKNLKKDADMYKVLFEIYKQINYRDADNKWKKTILLAGMIYKNQILKSLYSPFIEFEYKKFIDNIKSMQ